MSCNDRFDRLLTYSTGELSARESAEMGEHLKVCSICRERLETLRAMESCLRDSLRQPVSPTKTADRVMAIVSREARPAPRRRPFAWALACVIAAVVISAGVLMFNLSREHRQAKRNPHGSQAPAIAGRPRITPGASNAAPRSALRPHRVNRRAVIVRLPKNSKPSIGGRRTKAGVKTARRNAGLDGAGTDAEVSFVHESGSAATWVAGKCLVAMEPEPRVIERPVPVRKYVAERPPLFSEVRETGAHDSVGGTLGG